MDQYTLELTLREDTNGDGWTDGSEDSIGLDTTFTASDFNNRWVLLSAPLTGFFDRGTGGNGTFDGNVDELVIVFGGVQGGAATNIEIDFDQLTFTSGAPAAFNEAVVDDMEHGDPLGNGWFAFNGSVGGGGIAPNAADLPPASGGAFSLETGWGSGGNPGFYGGFGRTSSTDASGTEYFNFWINPNSGQDYTLEINFQEDDNSDGAANAADDDEFQFNCVVSPTGPCAVSGGGWQLVSIPLAAFFDDNSIFVGGNGVLDPTPASRGGNGELINALFVVIGDGSDVNFRTDYWAFSLEPIAHFMQIEQVIGGVNGDTTAQAIQLRLRRDGQNFVGGARLVARDAAGLNAVPVLIFGSNVANGVAGERILVYSGQFANTQMAPPASSDFTMTSLIPASYIPAGRLTFEDGLGTMYWSLCWGGAGYTGPATGSAINDADGNFGPCFAGPLPSTGLTALQFTSAAGAVSTNNAADYALTAGAAVITNNSGDSNILPVELQSFTVGD